MPDDPEFRWTQDDWGGDRPGAGSTRPLAAARGVVARHGWLVRGLILLLALVLFELTADAAVATAVSCLELGRTDFATALWLARTDPDRRRGWLCASCYLARALGRVCLMTLVAAPLVLAVVLLTGQQAIDPVPHFLGALAMALIAFLGAGSLSITVCLTALLMGRRIWLGPEPRRARRRGTWPPSLVAGDEPTANEARGLFHLACFCLAVPTLAAGAHLTLGNDNLGDFIRFLGGLGLILGVVLAGVVAAVTVLERRVLAASPADCWPIGGDAVNSPGGIR